jgi:Leucine-rich repeat (LRR) protein
LGLGVSKAYVSAMAYLPQIITIDVYQNKITQDLAVSSQFSNLKELYIDENKSFGEFKFLPKLEILSCYHDGFNSLEAINLFSLKYLNCSNNQINQDLTIFSQFKYLEELKISHNLLLFKRAV